MDVYFEFVTDVTDSDCPLAGLPSGATVMIYIVAAAASHAAADDTLTIVVPW